MVLFIMQYKVWITEILKSDPHSNRVQSSCITVARIVKLRLLDFRTLHAANLTIDYTDEILKWERLMKALTIEFSPS